LIAAMETAKGPDGRLVPARGFAYIAVYEFGLLGVLQAVFPALGISPVADGLGRDNSAARVATSGALLGAALAFSAAPTATSVPAFYGGFDLAALAVYLAGWGIVEISTGLSEPISIGRDLGSGIRLAGALVGFGLASGSVMAVIAGHRHKLLIAGAALIAFLALLILVERFAFRRRSLLSTRRDAMVSCVVGLVYLGLGVLGVISR
jgi:uncharacterized membrane protein YjfL (UPF0719 family)